MFRKRKRYDMTSKKPQVGDRKIIRGKMRVFNKNSRWELDKSGSLSNKKNAATVSDVKSDFSHNSNEEEKVSVLSKEFKEVLEDRYGLDPREIDEQRVELMIKEQQAKSRVSSQRTLLESAIRRKERFAHEDNAYVYQKEIDQKNKELEECKEELKACQEKLIEFEEEYPVEWTQYYLVSGGHFHNTLHCHSLYQTTRIGLYPGASGLEEDEAIELAGSRVCTHCIPNAPVDIEDRPSHVWTKDEKEKMEYQKRKEEEKKRKEEEKKRKKQEREAKQKASGNALLEPMVPFTLGGFTPEYIDTGRTINTVTRMKKYLRAANDMLMDDYVKEHVAFNKSDLDFDLSNVDNKYVDNIDPVSEREKVLKNNFGKDTYWLAKKFYGDISLAEQEFTAMHESVQSIADAKNVTFEKALDMFSSPRLLKATKENINSYYKRWGEEGVYDSRKMEEQVDEKTKLVRDIITSPSKIRELLES